LQTRRCRKSLGRLRGKALSIYNGAASNWDAVKIRMWTTKPKPLE
jgi:hypothetical protein